MPGYLARDNDDWSRIHIRVGNTGDRVSCSWTRRNQDHSNFTGYPGVSLSHMDSALLVAHKVMANPLSCSPQFVVNMENCTSGIPKNRIDTFEQQGLD